AHLERGHRVGEDPPAPPPADGEDQGSAQGRAPRDPPPEAARDPTGRTVTVHRAGQWNLRLGRAAKKVPALLRRERLDWLAVQELKQRGPWLQRRLNQLHHTGRLPAYTVVVAADGDS